VEDSSLFNEMMIVHLRSPEVLRLLCEVFPKWSRALHWCHGVLVDVIEGALLSVSVAVEQSKSEPMSIEDLTLFIQDSLSLVGMGMDVQKEKIVDVASSLSAEIQSLLGLESSATELKSAAGFEFRSMFHTKSAIGEKLSELFAKIESLQNLLKRKKVLEHSKHLLASMNYVTSQVSEVGAFSREAEKALADWKSAAAKVIDKELTEYSASQEALRREEKKRRDACEEEICTFQNDLKRWCNCWCDHFRVFNEKLAEFEARVQGITKLFPDFSGVFPPENCDVPIVNPDFTAPASLDSLFHGQMCKLSNIKAITECVLERVANCLLERGFSLLLNSKAAPVLDDRFQAESKKLPDLVAGIFRSFDFARQDNVRGWKCLMSVQTILLDLRPPETQTSVSLLIKSFKSGVFPGTCIISLQELGGCSLTGPLRASYNLFWFTSSNQNCMIKIVPPLMIYCGRLEEPTRPEAPIIEVCFDFLVTNPLKIVLKCDLQAERNFCKTFAAPPSKHFVNQSTKFHEDRRMSIVVESVPAYQGNLRIRRSPQEYCPEHRDRIQLSLCVPEIRSPTQLQLKPCIEGGRSRPLLSKFFEKMKTLFLPGHVADMTFQLIYEVRDMHTLKVCNEAFRKTQNEGSASLPASIFVLENSFLTFRLQESASEEEAAIDLHWIQSAQHDRFSIFQGFHIKSSYIPMTIDQENIVSNACWVLPNIFAKQISDYLDEFVKLDMILGPLRIRDDMATSCAATLVKSIERSQHKLESLDESLRSQTSVDNVCKAWFHQIESDTKQIPFLIGSKILPALDGLKGNLERFLATVNLLYVQLSKSENSSMLSEASCVFNDLLSSVRELALSFCSVAFACEAYGKHPKHGFLRTFFEVNDRKLDALQLSICTNLLTSMTFFALKVSATCLICLSHAVVMDFLDVSSEAKLNLLEEMKTKFFSCASVLLGLKGYWRVDLSSALSDIMNFVYDLRFNTFREVILLQDALSLLTKQSSEIESKLTTQLKPRIKRSLSCVTADSTLMMFSKLSTQEEVLLVSDGSEGKGSLQIISISSAQIVLGSSSQASPIKRVFRVWNSSNVKVDFTFAVESSSFSIVKPSAAQLLPKSETVFQLSLRYKDSQIVTCCLRLCAKTATISALATLNLEAYFVPPHEVISVSNLKRLKYSLALSRDQMSMPSSLRIGVHESLGADSAQLNTLEGIDFGICTCESMDRKKRQLVIKSNVSYCMTVKMRIVQEESNLGFGSFSMGKQALSKSLVLGPQECDDIFIEFLAGTCRGTMVGLLEVYTSAVDVFRIPMVAHTEVPQLSLFRAGELLLEPKDGSQINFGKVMIPKQKTIYLVLKNTCDLPIQVACCIEGADKSSFESSLSFLQTSPLSSRYDKSLDLEPQQCGQLKISVKSKVSNEKHFARVRIDYRCDRSNSSPLKKYLNLCAATCKGNQILGDHNLSLDIKKNKATLTLKTEDEVACVTAFRFLKVDRDVGLPLLSGCSLVKTHQVKSSYSHTTLPLFI
jgi:hypothetical protein